MSKCVFAGSFDPITNGHVSVIKRLAEIFDEVLVVVSINEQKQLVATGEQRLSMVKKSLENKNVSAVSHAGLLAPFCVEQKATCIVKGVRNQDDYEYEVFQRNFNFDISNIETLFMPCEAELEAVSSTGVRQAVALGQSIENLVPKAIVSDVLKLYATNCHGF